MLKVTNIETEDIGNERIIIKRVNVEPSIERYEMNIYVFAQILPIGQVFYESSHSRYSDGAIVAKYREPKDIFFKIPIPYDKFRTANFNEIAEYIYRSTPPDFRHDIDKIIRETQDKHRKMMGW